MLVRGREHRDQMSNDAVQVGKSLQWSMRQKKQYARAIGRSRCMRMLRQLYEQGAQYCMTQQIKVLHLHTRERRIHCRHASQEGLQRRQLGRLDATLHNRKLSRQRQAPGFLLGQQCGDRIIQYLLKMRLVMRASINLATHLCQPGGIHEQLFAGQRRMGSGLDQTSAVVKVKPRYEVLHQVVHRRFKGEMIDQRLST